MSRTLGILVLIAFCVLAPAHATESLLQIGQPPSSASFLGCNSDNLLQFQIANKTSSVSLGDLIRWSNPQSNANRPEAILIDGSRLVLAESWSGKKAFQVSAETATLLTKTFGQIVIPRPKLQTLLLNTPHRLRFRNQRPPPQKTDRLWLTSGDTLAGQLLEIGRSTPTIQFALDGTTKPISFPINRVAALTFGSRPDPPAKGNLTIGWRDGSLLVAETLVTKTKTAQIKLACAVELQADDPRKIVHLQSLRSRAVYLSDMKATDYTHQPFLSIPWKYRQDRNLQGGPLTASQQIYAKGIAMHSTSRLTYDLPSQSHGVATPWPHRFAAQVAIDDSTDGRGSVVFQVFLRQAGKLRRVLTTPIVRAEDAPLPISVPLGKAEQIVLAIEYADHGDQGDHANWLDARLERPTR